MVISNYVAVSRGIEIGTITLFVIAINDSLILDNYRFKRISDLEETSRIKMYKDKKKTYVAFTVPVSNTSVMIASTNRMTFSGSHFSTTKS